jgi:hypothetical protein
MNLGLVHDDFSPMLTTFVSNSGISIPLLLYRESIAHVPCRGLRCRVFKKELYNFENLYKFIQRACKVF